MEIQAEQAPGNRFRRFITGFAFAAISVVVAFDLAVAATAGIEAAGDVTQNSSLPNPNDLLVAGSAGAAAVAIGALGISAYARRAGQQS